MGTTITFQRITTAWGEFRGAASEGSLCRIGLPGESEAAFLDSLQRMVPDVAPELSPVPILRQLEKQLEEYFAEQRRAFDLPLLFFGTPFQKAVWQELLNIPYGQTRSYLELACRLGNPKAIRAVGAANGANPLPIVVPCHRVIGAGGKLVGYGGGLEMKLRLLRLESAQLDLALEKI